MKESFSTQMSVNNLLIGLFLVFLHAEITGHIDWPWYYIGAPLLIPFALAFVYAFITAFIYNFKKRGL